MVLNAHIVGVLRRVSKVRARLRVVVNVLQPSLVVTLRVRDCRCSPTAAFPPHSAHFRI